MNKKNVILLFASFLISFFIIETIFRTNSNLISREFLTYLPNTNVKKKILNKKGFEIKENLYKIEEIKNYKFKYYLNNFPSITMKQILILVLLICFTIIMVFVTPALIYQTQK